jgi:ABC-type branched-subunit amino acid transport system ATPase component/ABC-type branched-subunit amino acid transport system permease subunit
MTLLGVDLPAYAVLFGFLSGLVYGLLAVGLVLVYRSSRFINFAHGEVGAFGAAVLSVLVVSGGVPYWVALPLGLLTAAALSAGVELTVVRRLSGAPKLMSMVGTIGAGQFLFLLSLAVAAQATQGTRFPVPPGVPEWTFRGNLVSPAYTSMLVLAPLAVLGLTLFFRRSRYGLAIRAAATNPDAAAMAGMSPQRLSTMTWAIAGALACLTAALLIPTLGAIGGSSLGPTLLLKALAAGVIGRMASLPIAFVAGVGIGIAEGVTQVNADAGFVHVVLFAIILVALLLQARPGRREEEKGSWAAVQAWPPLPEQLQAVWLVRNLGLVVGTVAVGVGLVVPLLLSNAQAYAYTVLLCFALVGLSLYIITGLAGQLSLGQFGIAAAGALAALPVSAATGSRELGILAAVVAGAAASVLVGLPALRVKGLLLAVTTLGFALAMQAWVLKQPTPLGFGNSRLVDTPVLVGVELTSARSYAAVAVLAVGLGMLVARNVRRGGFGRLLVALRDNEDAARAFSVAATRRKLQGYALAGALAGLAGAVYSYAQPNVSAEAFPATASTAILVMSVVGGVSLVAGPLLGAVVALPLVYPVPVGLYAAITLGWVTLVLYAPGGLAGLLRPLRDAVVDAVARMHGVDPVAARASADPARADTAASAPVALVAERPGEPTSEPAAPGTVLLRADGLTKRYGGLTAVDHACLEVRSGEVLGLIGPNGAGKTTLFECLSGFVKVDAGSIVFADRDVTRWSPERRASAGLIRSFQDSALFATMTVLETVLVAAERARPTGVAESVLGLPGRERLRRERARELCALLGLDRYRHTQVGQLSTGTRRIAELACLVSLEPTLLLLDEPSSGVAQREVEALGDVLLQVKRHLGTTLVVIEHDIPLLASISDRMVAMETGRVLVTGTPDEVLRDPDVVESYLGGDPTAVHRSDNAGGSLPDATAVAVHDADPTLAPTSAGRP